MKDLQSYYTGLENRCKPGRPCPAPQKRRREADLVLVSDQLYPVCVACLPAGDQTGKKGDRLVADQLQRAADPVSVWDQPADRQRIDDGNWRENFAGVDPLFMVCLFGVPAGKDTQKDGGGGVAASGNPAGHGNQRNPDGNFSHPTGGWMGCGRGRRALRERRGAACAG